MAIICEEPEDPVVAKVIGNGPRVLDCGCGTERIAHVLVGAALNGERYHAIVFCHVLAHLTERPVALRLAAEHLASNGRFVIVPPLWRHGACDDLS